MKLAIVGGGIAGLAAAWAARDRAEVTVFEPGRLGGKILTEAFAGRPVDCGPDAFITRVPPALELCRELDLESELVAPAAGRTWLWWHGRPRLLPDGLVLGVPRRVGPLLRSGILSPWGLLRAGGDLVLPHRPPSGDVSVHELLAARFGRQVADRLVDPLVGSIHAGRTEELSAAATVPQLLAAARHHRSLLLGLRGAGPARPELGAAMFLTPSGGLGVLVDRLVARATEAGVRFEAGPVAAVRPVVGGGVDVDGARFDGVVLATPTAVSARLLGPELAGELADLQTTSVVLTTLGYPGQLAPEGINGVLVPRREGRLMTACSFGSSKWPQWAEPGTTLLRVSSGRSGDNRAMELDDEVLVDRLTTEVGQLLGTTALPSAWRVNRWPGAFPRYEVGHLDRIKRIEDRLRTEAPGVALAGAGYRGAGIPACVASGRSAIEALLAHTGVAASGS